MNGFVRSEFVYDSYMVTELKRMKVLNRPIIKDNQYSSVLAPNDQCTINHMINMIQDKLRLDATELQQVQATLVTEFDAGKKITEEEMKDFLEPYDPENMGKVFLCPNTERCGSKTERTWKGMMDHAWNNQEAAKADPKNKDHLRCYDAVSEKDKLYYDRHFSSTTKKGKAQPAVEDASVRIRPSYEPLASFQLLRTLQDAHHS